MNTTATKWTPEEIYNYAKRWAKLYARKLNAAHIVDELIQEAALGIIRGLQTYDTTKGNENYVKGWALAYMRRHARSMSLVVKRHKYNRQGHTQTYSLVAGEFECAEHEAGTHRDLRGEAPAGHVVAEFNQAWERADSLTRKAVHSKLVGGTFKDVAEQEVLSGEYVRQKFLQFGKSKEEITSEWRERYARNGDKARAGARKHMAKKRAQEKEARAVE